MMAKKCLFSAVFVASVALSGCQTAYYSAMEQVGVHKRDILVDRVEGARDAQDEAQQQFKDALEQYRSVVSFEGDRLDTVYQALDAEYEQSLEVAQEVSDRIELVESVADALFDEWAEELNLYTNPKLRADSAAQLKQTKRRYNGLIASMKTAEKRMQPVLDTLQDNVLYLKHNLNARAIGALKGELGNIQSDVELLIRDVNRAIAQSDAFIADMERG